MMKKTLGTMKAAATCVVVLVVAAASANQEEAVQGGLLEADYEEFQETGVLDPELTNLMAEEKVLRGITSGQPRIVELTLLAMAEEANRRALDLTVVVRSFSQVPGLKEFLIGYWHDNIGDDWDGTAAVAPTILAVHFPGDEDVHHLIWEQHALTGNVFGTLVVLNAGRFTTPEADALRIESLSSDDMLVFAAGALGIAMSKPEEGLDALVESLKSNPVSAEMLATRRAFSAYGPEAMPALQEEIDAGHLGTRAARMLSEVFEEIAPAVTDAARPSTR